MLLTIPIFSIVIWMVKGYLSRTGMVYAIIPLEAIRVTNNTTVTNDIGFQWDIPDLYWIGVAIFIGLFVIKTFRILIFFRNAKYDDGIIINSSTNDDSFSFFNFIHLRADLNSEEKKIVLAHELIHYRKHHSLDLILYEIYHSLFWFNPLLIFIKKELVNIHEFEVDQDMYAKYKTNYMRHLLSYALGSNNSHYLLSSPFYNKLTLKKRIQTMKNSNKTNSILLLLSLPILAITFTMVSCETENMDRPIDGSQRVHIDSPLPDNAPPTPPVPERYVQKDDLTKLPEFPGGTDAMYKYMGENIQYPEKSKQDNVSGKVLVNFTIKETGKIAFIKIEQGVSSELDSEAIRVIKNMPDWIPGEMDGKKVSSQMTLPIMFKMN
jgi:TonB family protein